MKRPMLWVLIACLFAAVPAWGQEGYWRLRNDMPKIDPDVAPEWEMPSGYIGRVFYRDGSRVEFGFKLKNDNKPYNRTLFYWTPYPNLLFPGRVMPVIVGRRHLSGDVERGGPVATMGSNFNLARVPNDTADSEGRNTADVAPKGKPGEVLELQLTCHLSSFNGTAVYRYFYDWVAGAAPPAPNDPYADVKTPVTGSSPAKPAGSGSGPGAAPGSGTGTPVTGTSAGSGGLAGVERSTPGSGGGSRAGTDQTAAILGEWVFRGNNYPGTLTFERAGGQIVGHIFYDTVGRPEQLVDVRFNPRTGEIYFTRPWVGNPTFQKYGGTLENGSITGSFGDSNVPGKRFPWWARRR